ncbi:MAG: hypothetical protein HP490_10205 [Nitrospira sp.]|nr:hypothetical protein [Nitrospira sp.]
MTDERVNRAGPVDVNGLEAIPTAVPREGDGYQSSRKGTVEPEPKPMGEPGFTLTEDDLRRVNTRKGMIELLENRGVDIQEVLKTLLYEQELRQLQVELVKLQRWVQSSGERIAILVEGRDAAGKGGTIRRFTEHLNPRAMRVVALPKPTDEERGQWYVIQASGVVIWICGACAIARQIGGSELVAGASIKGMPDYIKAVAERDRNVAF